MPAIANERVAWAKNAAVVGDFDFTGVVIAEASRISVI